MTIRVAVTHIELTGAADPAVGRARLSVYDDATDPKVLALNSGGAREEVIDITVPRADLDAFLAKCKRTSASVALEAVLSDVASPIPKATK